MCHSASTSRYCACRHPCFWLNCYFQNTKFYDGLIIPPTQRSCWGVYWFHSIRPSIHPSVCPSVRPSVRPASRVLSVASTVQDGFFSYLVQMINSMRGWCDDSWPWPISSRSFGFDLENRVRSVASTVLDGLLLYLAHMITIIRCVMCLVFSKSGNLNFWQIFRPWPWKKKSTVLNGFFPYLAPVITSMRGCVANNNLWSWPILSRSFGLGLENLVRSVASTVLDGFFPYLVQMITTMRKCVACDDLWLTYIFKVIWPLLWKSCPLCNVFSCR